MPRPSNRDAILDAFVDLVREGGDRAATLDAVAERAGVSKGGLLYHFGSREALVDGLAGRLDALAAADTAAMRGDADGPVAAFLRSSVADDGPMDRTIVALARMAQDDRYPEARRALRELEDGWRDLVAAEIPDDPVVARIVKLVSDGLYHASMMDAAAAEHPSPVGIDEIVAAIDLLRRTRAEG